MNHARHPNASRRPILVTGAAGFIGSRILEALVDRGSPVIAVDAREHFRSRNEHRTIDPSCIVDVAELPEWLEAAPEAESIVHLGACTNTRETDRAHLTTRNVEASQRLWRWARTTGVPFIYASSAATYGDGALGYDDDESRIPRLEPLNAYGESKQAFDLWALAEERRGCAPAHWCGLKLFNVYGFGERHKGQMSSVVLQAFDQVNETGRLRLFRSGRPDIAHGHQARDFVFVDDVVDTLIALVDAPPRRGIFNLGSGRARTFLDLAHAVFGALGAQPRIEFVDAPPDVRAHYQYFTQATTDRLRSAGYLRHITQLEDGVRRYVDALRSHPES